MASVHQFYVDAHFIGRHIVNLYNELADGDRDNYFAAVIIQRSWKGYKVRKMVKGWHKAATTIQKYVRGWLLRWHLPQIYENYLKWYSWRTYNKMATRIQALWRGYRARKAGVNVKHLREQRRLLAEKNKELQQMLRDAFEDAKRKKEEEVEREAKNTVIFILFRLHHLVRTRQIKGIYSLDSSSKLSLIEQMLKSVKFKEYMRCLRQKYAKRYKEVNKPKPKSYISNKILLKNFEDAYRLRDTSKDVKNVFKLEGPYREKQFDLPRKLSKEPYEREMFCVGEYERPPMYYLREYDKTKNIASEFDLFLQKMDLRDREIPYYTDLWSKMCEIHHLEDC